MMKITRRTIFIVLIFIFTASFAAFVWPTRYRYDRINEDGIRPIRIDRFTGKTEILFFDGWMSAEPAKPPQKYYMPSSLLSDVTLEYYEDGTLGYCNATDWTVTDIYIKFSNNDKSEIYHLYCGVEPYTEHSRYMDFDDVTSINMYESNALMTVYKVRGYPSKSYIAKIEKERKHKLNRLILISFGSFAFILFSGMSVTYITRRRRAFRSR